MAGPRFQPFNFIWSRYNWYAFKIRKEKVYNVIHRITIYSMLSFTVYLGASVIYLWNSSVHRNWKHFVRKEQQRKELMDAIRAAREKGLIAPSEAADFE